MTLSSKNLNGLMVGAFAAVYLGWGSTYLAIRVALESFPPFTIGALRFLAAGGVLYLWARSRGAGKPTLKQWGNATVMGALMFLIGNGFVIWAEERVPSGIAALMIASLPVFMTVLASLQKNTPRPKLTSLLGIALGLVGVAVLVRPFSSGQGALSLVDAAKLLFAAICWASGSLFSKKADLPTNPKLAVAMEMLMGGVLMGIVSTASGEWGRVSFAAVSTKSWLALGYLTVVGSLVAFSAYMWLLRNVAPERASTYAYVNPIVAVALGSWLGGEAIGLTTLIAGAIIILSVILILSPRVLLRLRITLPKPLGNARYLLK